MWNDGDNNTEQIDTCEDNREAEYLRKEYQLAYKGYVWIVRGR